MQRLAITTMTALVLLNSNRSDAGGKSNAVKATATATKIDKNGKQTVTITLDIQKGWSIYANPVNFWAFEDNQTNVRFKAKQGVMAEVKYPAGKTHAIGGGKIKLQMYEGRATIDAVVERTPGDVSPLEIAIDFVPTDFRICWFPETIKLLIP